MSLQPYWIKLRTVIKDQCLIRRYLLEVLFLFFVSCSIKENISERNLSAPSSSEIVELVERLAIKSTTEKNVHISYIECFNDSTWMLRMQQNNSLGNEELGVCEVIKFRDGNIFIYDKDCHNSLEEGLRSEVMPFQLDGISNQILLERRDGRLVIYKLKRVFQFDSDFPHDHGVDSLYTPD